MRLKNGGQENAYAAINNKVVVATFHTSICQDWFFGGLQLLPLYACINNVVKKFSICAIYRAKNSSASLNRATFFRSVLFPIPWSVATLKHSTVRKSINRLVPIALSVLQAVHFYNCISLFLFWIIRKAIHSPYSVYQATCKSWGCKKVSESSFFELYPPQNFFIFIFNKAYYLMSWKLRHQNSKGLGQGQAGNLGWRSKHMIASDFRASTQTTGHPS